MHNPKRISRLRHAIFACLCVLLASPSVPAMTLTSEQACIWGIDADQVAIPSGSVITEAVVTIHNVIPLNAQMEVYLLDNPAAGTEILDSAGLPLAEYGVPLGGSVVNGDWVCRLSQVNDTQSWVWDHFAYPFTLTLADSRLVTYPSSLLNLIDYFGNGGSFGIGIDSAEEGVLQFSSISLELTISSFQGQVTSTTLTLTDDPFVLKFDGESDSVNLNNSAPMNNFTVTAWVKAGEIHQVDAEGLLGAAGISGQNFLFCPDYYAGNNSGMGVSVGINGISVYEHGSGYLPAIAVYEGNLGRDWNHIAIAYADRQPHIYLNGVLVHIGLTSLRDNVFGPRFIGGFAYGAFRGEVYDVQMWDTTLTAQEVASSMDRHSGVTGSAGSWKFDEGSGTTVYDHSGNGYTGTVYGVDWVSIHAASQADPYSLEFNGIGDTLHLNNTTPVNNFTISAWVKAARPHGIDSESTFGADGISGQNYLFSPDYHAGDSSGMGISVGINGISIYEHGSGYLPALAVYEGNLGRDWNHIAVTYTDREPRIYLNGVLVCTGLVSARSNVYAPSMMGGSAYGYFKGAVFDVQIWDSVLTAQEVADSMDSDSGIIGSAGYWKLDEGAGATAYDSSGNQFNGAIHGPDWTVIDHADAASYALDFDGTGDSLHLNNTAVTNNFTVSAWVKADRNLDIHTESDFGAAGIFGQNYLFCPDYHAGDSSGMGVSVGRNGIAVYEHGSGYLPALAVYEGNLGTGWNHVAVTYTNRQPRIYLNGVLVRTGLPSARGTVFGPQFMAGFAYGYFDGSVYDVQIWDSALTAQQVADSMDSDSGQTASAGHWRFDEGDGSTVYDSSGNGYQGTVYDAEWVVREQ